MWFTKMHDVLYHLEKLSNYLPAILITAGIAVLIACVLSCVRTPCKDKDELFHREIR